MDGRIVREGGPELALELEEKGYEGIRADVAATASN
jgi:Fe-S cluster assembly ATP-binding protein